MKPSLNVSIVTINISQCDFASHNSDFISLNSEFIFLTDIISYFKLYFIITCDWHFYLEDRTYSAILHMAVSSIHINIQYINCLDIYTVFADTQCQKV